MVGFGVGLSGGGGGGGVIDVAGRGGAGGGKGVSVRRVGGGGGGAQVSALLRGPPERARSTAADDACRRVRRGAPTWPGRLYRVRVAGVPLLGGARLPRWRPPLPRG